MDNNNYSAEELVISCGNRELYNGALDMKELGKVLCDFDKLTDIRAICKDKCAYWPTKKYDHKQPIHFIYTVLSD